MEEGNSRSDLQRNLGKQSTTRAGSGLKSVLSGRSTPRGSPSFRRLNSSRTPGRDGRIGGFSTQCFRSNRILLWLLLITLWAYAGFYVQSRWAHGDNEEGIFGYGSNPSDESSESEEIHRRELSVNNISLAVNKVGVNVSRSDLKKKDIVLAEKRNGVTLRPSIPLKKGSKRSGRRSRKSRGKQKIVAETKVSSDSEVQEEEIPLQNSTYGLLVGPFGSIEDTVLEWSPEKRSGTCDRKGQFARLVWSRKFVLIFHELSMTGAPLSMMELATELLSCGATVSAVVLSRKGGLMPELARRRIKVLEDKDKLSFKTAMKADLVIAGSAVCASWIEQYLEHSVAGTRQLVWWIMENRREYFDRSKLVLNRVKMLVFLSESQSKQWLAWCEEEKIQFKSQPGLIPLSVNDELAFAAGIACSLNTPAFSTEKMLEKRHLLRNSVREEMGLTDNDMLVMTLSSINPGKGQFLLLESARLMSEQVHSPNDSQSERSTDLGEDYHSRALLQSGKQLGESSDGIKPPNKSLIHRRRRRKMKKVVMPRVFNSTRHSDVETFEDGGNFTKVLNGSEEKHVVTFEDGGNLRNMLNGSEEEKEQQNLKILIGSVGSKSNKVPYVKAVLSFLSQHSNLSKSVLWTPSTTRVASLYAAADVYVINSQGLGETFGRVTIEAMAFGLPVLGTDAGGTKEIVEHNVTGLLHPVGHPGTHVLSKNLRFMLENPSVRQQMGLRGRQKVKNMYLKGHMYKIFGEVLYNTMKVK